MPKPSWQVALSIMIRYLPRRDRPPRLVVLGMGQRLRGDDAVGPIMADELRRMLRAADSVLILDAGPAPENFTGPIRSFAPDLVLLIDAAQMDEPAGTIRLLDSRDCTGLSASTHTLPPCIVADYLCQETACEVALLGVQPLEMEVGARLSTGVRAAADQIVRGVVETLRVHAMVASATGLEGREDDGAMPGWGSLSQQA